MRKHLLESCNLHTILDMPAGTFTGAGVKTVVLFFQKGEPTKNIWYYQLDAGRSLGKTNPLNDKDLEEFVSIHKERPNTEKSWVFNVKDLDENSFDLAPKNPNKPKEKALRSPENILDEMEILDKETSYLLTNIKKLIS